MVLRSATNQFPGINPHLNSWLQNTFGAWESFHFMLIGEMHRQLTLELPTGYYVFPEQSLQIRAEASEKLRYPKPDLSIFARQPTQSPSATLTATAPTLIQPVRQTMLTSEDYLHALVIYRGDDPTLSQPVARIEVLSPTNKPYGSGYGQYLEKRIAALESRIPLLELDFLHQTPPVLTTLPHYPDEPEARPYVVMVNDPRPNPDEGISQIYLFGVADALPIIEIPLLGEDRLIFELATTYHAVFSFNPYFHQVVVNYAELPLKFESYSPTDQRYIEAQMRQLAQVLQ